MKRLTLLAFILLISNFISHAQVAEYLFSQQNLSYIEITGGTELWSGTFDNEVSTAITIPAFTFNGTEYTELYVSANGFVSFALAPTTSNYTPISTTAAYSGAISAFGCNLIQAESGSPSVRYEFSGTEFIVQWKDVRRNGVSGEIVSCQIRLNTSDNTIKIVYGGNITPGSNSTYPQVGLRGSTSSDYNNRYLISTGGDWVNSTAGTANSRNMYFNSGAPTAVPTTGLTYYWKPLYNPIEFKAEAISASEIDLSWIKNTLGHNVMLAYNTVNTFGIPVNGTTYSAGNSIVGGGTILFYDNGTSFNHTSLSPNTVYYYKIWSYEAIPDYSTGTTASTSTAYNFPYLQVFSTTSTPAGWTTNMSFNNQHGTSGTIGIYKQISSGSTTYYATSPLVGSITSASNLSFHYRIVDNLGFPLNATILGANDKIDIQVSLDDGATYSTFYSIDQSMHIASTEFVNKVVSLSAFAGDYIKVKFVITWGEGNYYVDIDNVLFEDGTNMSYSGGTVEQANTSNAAINSSNNDVIRLQVITQKDANPLSITSITFNTTGTTNATNDLDAAKVYYTTTPVFSAGTQFGTTYSSPSGTFSINGSQALAQGNNYFWLAYDIKSTATVGNSIDGQCTQFVSSESGIVKTPTLTTVTGVRKIGESISGIKNIPADYVTIAAAVTALNSGVVGAGGVTFNVAAGHTESSTLPIELTATGSASNPIVFQKSGTGDNPLVTRSDAGSVTTSTLGYHGDGVIIIEGSDYVSFDGIDVATSDQGIEYGYYLRKASVTNGCKNVTVKNANITMTKGTSKVVVGLCAANNSSSTSNISITHTDGSHGNVIVTGNTISNVFTGIYLKGSTDFYDQNFTIGDLEEGNTIKNFAGNTAFESYGIYLDKNHSSKIQYNNINNTDGGGSAFTSNASGIYNACSDEVDFSAISNIINLMSVSSRIYGIYNAASGDISLKGNTISISNTSSSTNEYVFIENLQSSATTTNNTEISNNNFTSSEIQTTGSTYLIRNNNSRKSPEVTSIDGNQSSMIHLTGASGFFYLYYNASTATGTEEISNNDFSGITLSGSSYFWGIYSSTHASHTQNVHDNTIRNITGGTNTTSTINLVVANNRSVYGNSIHDISGGGAVTGIRSGTGSTLFKGYRNEIYNLSSSSTSSTNGLVNGILVESGSAVYLYNNFISDLKAPSTSNSDAIRGISITSTLANSAIGIYYNTIYLDATSVGTNFGTSGIYHTANSTATTATLDLRNNIIVNKSTPNGFSTTVAFRRSLSTLNNYAATSNNNVFYAGTPGTNNLIYTPASCQTIEAFKTLVGPNRDSVSFLEMPPFINVATTPYNLRLADGMASFCESGAKLFTSPLAITDDYDGVARSATPDIGADEFAGVSAFVEPVASFSASALNSQQIELVFAANENEDDVVIVYNATGTFTSPTGIPVQGESLAGGTIIYYGSTSPVTHSGLTPGTKIYYKAFCYNGTNYSIGRTDNGTPEVTPLTGLVAVNAGSTTIDLNWIKNRYDHNVLVTSSSAYFSGNPVNGTNYNVGDVIPSAGTVIYKGPATGYDQIGLNVWSQYYYKIWSVDSYNYYSSGIFTNEITDANPITEFPYLQDFNGIWSHYPVAPNKWKNVELSGSWSRSSLIAHSLYGASGSGSGSTNHYLISPPIVLPDTANQISWWDKVSNASSNNSYKVLLSTTNSEVASFTVELGDFDCTNTTWTMHLIDLSAYKGQTVYIAFQHYYCQSQYSYFAIDDVIIETLIPSDAELVFPTEELLTFNNPLLKWKAPITSEPVSYKVYLDTNTDPTTLIYDGTDLSFQTSGLNFGTTYHWKVIPYNVYGQAMDVPVWSFSTVTATQLAESFEADFFPPVGWSSPMGWSLSDNFYHGIQSTRGYTYSTPLTKLITPLLHIAEGDELAFFEGTSSSTYQRIQIMYSSDNVDWNNLGEPIHVAVSAWGFHSIDLSTLAGNDYYLAFVVFYDTGGTNTFVYLDHVTGPEIVPVVPKAATNPKPIDTDDFISTTCTLSWAPDNTGGIPAGYKLYVDSHTNPTTLVYNGFDPSHTVSSLLYNTTYYWKVVPCNSAGDAIDCQEWSFTTVAEGCVQVGRGDDDYLVLSIDPDYNYNYSQTIYLQSEIGISGKRISKIYYHYNGDEVGNTFNDWVIYLGHTTKTAFASTSDWVPYGQLTKVFDGEVALTANEAWVEIILDTPFEYNNTDNLVLAVDENTMGYASNNPYFYGTEFSTSRGIIYSDDVINPDPASPPTADYLVEEIANLRMQFEEIPTTPEFRVSPESKDFEVVFINTESEPQIFTIKNNGTGTLSILGVTKSGIDASQFNLTDANSYPVALASNQTISVSVVFLPTSEGSKTATLVITDDLTGAHQVLLSGNCVDPRINIFPFTETFEDDSPSRDMWSQIRESGTSDWTYATGAGSGSIETAHNGTLNARFTGSSSQSITKLVSPIFDLSGLTSPQVTFWYAQELWSPDQNELVVYYRTAFDQPWVEIFSDDLNVFEWTEKKMSLPNPSSTYQLGFEGIDNYGYPNVLDDVVVGSSVVTPSVPVDTSLTSLTVSSSESVCFNAQQTITVAGTGNVDFESGSMVNFIAGQSIRFLPGFHAKAGSTVNAWITTNGTFCGVPLGSPLLSYDATDEKSVELEEGVELLPANLNEKQVKLYPNPNKGQFSLQLGNFDSRTEIRVFNLLGKVFYSATVYSPQYVDIDMLNAPHGVYSVLVSDHNTLKTIKMVIY